ncbi:MAG: 1-acyl-sn-glycerol-3-phosphate acyltransferase [Clostridiales bacterium]|nr:1-acyl-sn-glycerol-3-phosphate acyltransferase [Clostridiales bacterium]
MRKKRNKNTFNRRQPIWKCVSGVLRLFMKKPKIINLAGELPDRAIYVANHSAMFGPVIYNLYLPAKVAPWGAYPMLGTYKERYHYLRDVYFIQKRHKNKAAATILAGLEALVSKCIYRGMNVIPSYNDSRFIATVRKSLKALEEKVSVMIFPENSNEGYHEILKGFFAGFVELARCFKLRHHEDVPIVPVYYHQKKKVMVIGKPSKLTEYTDKGMNRQQIAASFCQQVNDLFLKYIKGVAPQKT